MGGTLLTLWILSLLMSLLKQIFPYKKEEEESRHLERGINSCQKRFGGGLYGLVAGFTNLHWSNPIMIVVGLVLLYLGIKKDFEPLLLVPIGFGCILVNIPLAGLMEAGGFSEDHL